MATPQAEPSELSQNLTTGISVTLTCETDGAKMYYTLDGSAPGTDKTLYSGPVSIQTSEASKTLKAVATKEGMAESEVLEITYTNSAVSAAAAYAAPASLAAAAAEPADAGTVAAEATAAKTTAKKARTSRKKG